MTKRMYNFNEVMNVDALIIEICLDISLLVGDILNVFFLEEVAMQSGFVATTKHSNNSQNKDILSSKNNLSC